MKAQHDMSGKNILSAFWQGYGKALNLFPAPQATPSRFMFRGRDLSKLTASEALGQDWSMVGSSITSALNKMSEQEDERRPIESTR